MAQFDPPPVNQAMFDPQGELSSDWYRWFQSVFHHSTQVVDGDSPGVLIDGVIVGRIIHGGHGNTVFTGSGYDFGTATSTFTDTLDLGGST